MILLARRLHDLSVRGNDMKNILITVSTTFLTSAILLTTSACNAPSGTNQSSSSFSNSVKPITIAVGSPSVTPSATPGVLVVMVPSPTPVTTPTSTPAPFATPTLSATPAQQEFTATSAMTSNRNSPVAATLQNGRVLVAGGSSHGLYLQTAEVYDPQTGKFIQTGSMSHYSAGIATVLQDGSVLIAGGFLGPNGGPAHLALELYDPNQGTFSLSGASLASRPFSAVLLQNGDVFFLEGSDNCSDDGHIVYHQAELYHVASKTVSAQSFMGGTVATLLQDGTILIRGIKGCVFNDVVGGYNNVFSGKASIFDTSIGMSGMSTTVGNSYKYYDGSAPSRGQSLLLNNGNVFFSDYSNGTQYFQIYDSRAHTFSTVSQESPTPGGTPVKETQDGKLWLVDADYGALNIYDLSSQTLVSPAATMAFDHGNGASVILQNGNLLVVGNEAGPANAEYYLAF